MSPTSEKTALAQRILTTYGVEYAQIFPAETGYRNHSFKVELKAGSYINLMMYKAEPGMKERITRADAVAKMLANQHLPTRLRVDPRLLQLQNTVDTHVSFAALYNYLPGTTISWEAYTKNHIKLLGKTMALMHAQLAILPNVHQLPLIHDGLRKLLQSMQDYFKSPDVIAAARHKLQVRLLLNPQRFKAALTLGATQHVQHPLHMDFVRSNVLFGEGGTVDQLTLENVSITGIIDFEKVSFGSPLFDLARTLAFLLVDCKHKTADQVRKYFLYSGYVKRGGQPAPDTKFTYSDKTEKLLDVYVQLFLLHDFYKFLKHNPYESLAENEHYIRTRDILQAQGMLEYIQKV